jgi:hypothetical protein
LRLWVQNKQTPRRRSSQVKLARFRKPKATCIFFYVGYRLNTNISKYYQKQVTVWEGHIWGREDKRRKLR